jgi:DNA-binding NarL/FixJ family response regulator
VIRVAVVDAHPAMRAGLEAFLRTLPGVVVVGTAAGDAELWPLLYRARPDVVVVDDPALALRVTARRPAPRVVICAQRTGGDALMAARMAGADALVDKAAELRELGHAVREAAAGRPVLPRITPRAQARAAARLGPVDRAIFAMTLAGTAPADVAATVGLGLPALQARTGGIVTALGTHVPADAPLELVGEAA